jgi:UDP-glucose 4-epimerase
MIAGSRIVVTGGCGFIGSHLVRRLLERGAARVVVIDSQRYGDPANLGEQSAAVELVRHTLGSDDPAQLRDLLRGARYLFHLAAEKHNQSKDNPLEVLRANIDGSYALFDAAARGGVEKIVFTSSLYAYGRMQGPPFVEDEVPRPQTVYGISKLCGEHLLRHVHAAHGVSYNVLRYLFVYGPRQFAGMGYKSVIVKNFERLLDEQSPTVYGDGAQTLDYVFVDDAVEAAIRGLESEVSGEVFNIGTGVATSVEALIDCMLKVSGRNLPKRHEAPDWTAGSSRVGDISKARRMLGWSPRVELTEGLTRTFEWMTENRRG